VIDVIALPAGCADIADGGFCRFSGIGIDVAGDVAKIVSIV
jgi:hypothetical protein